VGERLVGGRAGLRGFWEELEWSGRGVLYLYACLDVVVSLSN
jgi:hypothetical protein